MLGLVLWRYAHIYTQIRGLQTHLLDHKHFFLWFFYPLLVYPWKPGKTKLRMTHQEGKCDPGKLKKRLFSCIWHMRCCWVSKTRLNYCKQETILREKKKTRQATPGKMECAENDSSPLSSVFNCRNSNSCIRRVWCVPTWPEVSTVTCWTTTMGLSQSAQWRSETDQRLQGIGSLIWTGHVCTS